MALESLVCHETHKNNNLSLVFFLSCGFVVFFTFLFPDGEIEKGEIMKRVVV